MSVLITILTLLALVIALTGIIGAIVPALPGPPLCFASLVMVYFAFPGETSWQLLLIMFVVTVLVTVLDYVAPLITAKAYGGSKRAMWGVTLGLIAGLFFMPWGLVIGPFLGALLGEYIHEQRLDQSLKVAASSFVSFLLTTGLKLLASLVMAYYTAVPVYHTIHHSIADLIR